MAGPCLQSPCYFVVVVVEVEVGVAVEQNATRNVQVVEVDVENSNALGKLGSVWTRRLWPWVAGTRGNSASRLVVVAVPYVKRCNLHRRLV